MNGKGDRDRMDDRAAYERNYDEIDWRLKKAIEIEERVLLPLSGCNGSVKGKKERDDDED